MQIVSLEETICMKIAKEANWSGSALFVIKYMNLYQQSSQKIGTDISWKLFLWER